MPRSPERQLISSILRNGDFKTATAHGVKQDMFHTHNDEWEWVQKYFQKYGKTPSIASFRRQFDEFVILKSTDTDYLADEVKRAHIRKQIIDVISDVADLIGDDDVDTALKKMSASLVTIAAASGSDYDGDIFRNYDDVMQEVEARVIRHNETGSAGIPTGISAIDDETGGSNPGELLILGARLGQGKSWILQLIAAQAAASGAKVQFDALEQSRAAVSMRIHTLLSSSVGKQVFQTAQLMKGKDFSLVEYKRFVRSLGANMKGALHVSDTSRGLVSPMTVMAQIEKNQPDIVFIDYLTLMAKTGPDWQGVAQLSSDLKSLATRYGIPIWAASQLNRTDGISRNDIPGAEALSQSDAIGQDADMVITQRQMSTSVLGMKMAKYRNGRSGQKWYMEFRPGDGVIKEVSYSRALDLIDKDKDDAAAYEEKSR